MGIIEQLGRFERTTLVEGAMAAGFAGGGLVTSALDDDARSHVVKASLFGAFAGFASMKTIIARDIPVRQWMVWADESIHAGNLGHGWARPMRYAVALGSFALIGAYAGALLVNLADGGRRVRHTAPASPTPAG